MWRIFAILLLLSSQAWAQQTKTFNQFIQGLPVTSSATSNDSLYILQGGVSKSIAPTAIGGGGGGGSSAGIVNVTSFGAKCDGVTDDTAAIQAAIIAAGMKSSVSGGGPPGSILQIPGLCAISGTVTARNRFFGVDSISTHAIALIQCVGAGSGLLWIGADNTAPMLQLGIENGNDGAFEVSGCNFGSPGRTANKPSAAIQMTDLDNSNIHDNIFGYVHDGVICGPVSGTNGCFLNIIANNTFGGCFNTCINTVPGAAVNGYWIKHNEFAQCGNYCIKIFWGDTVHVISNDFEGQNNIADSDVGGPNGSVSFGDPNGSTECLECNMIANRFEDCPGSCAIEKITFRSVSIVRGAVQFFGNGYGSNGGHHYFIEILNNSQAEFYGEYTAAAATSNFADLESSTGARFVGGYNCTSNQIWGGGQASLGELVSACNDGAYAQTRGGTSWSSTASGVTMSGLPTTPTGKQPLCIDASTGQIYKGSAGGC